MTDPVVLIDTSGSILNCNAAATLVVEADDGISILDNRLRFGNMPAEPYFHSLLQRAGDDCLQPAGRSFVVPRPSGKRPYLVAIRPLPPPATTQDLPVPESRSAAAIVAIRDPESFVGVDPGLLSQSYDLSPTEIELAVALDGGATVRTVADRRGVAITTVRSQLYALMGKVYVTRQIDLIRLLQQYRAPL